MCKAVERELAIERMAGKIEGCAASIISLLEDLGAVPDKLKEEISKQSDLDLLHVWLKLAAKSKSIQEFEEKIYTN